LRKGALSQSEAREILSGCFHVIERL